MTGTLWRIAAHNLRRRPARSAVTAAAVALGVAAVVALSSIAWGFEASWQRANDARGTDLIVTRLASENTMPSPFESDAVAPVLRGLPHVDEVAGLLSEMLGVDDGGPPMFVFGWAWHSYLWKHLRLVDGRWPASPGTAEAMLGRTAAELLHKRVGDTVTLEGEPFRVAGVFESEAVVENGAVLVSLAQAQRITDKPGKVNVLNLRLDGGATPEAARAIQAAVKARLPGYIAYTSGELVRRNAVVRIAKAMSAATVLVAALVGALVVFNSMLMSVNERTREIGLLQAIGWPRRDIVALVLGEALLLAGAGGVLGVVLGAGGTAALGHMALLRGKFAPAFSLEGLPVLVGMCLLLGLAGGLLPAWKAARMAPAQALRHE